MRVVAFVTDLMDRSKLARLGEVTFGRDPGDAAGADAVIVDLGAHAAVVSAARGAAPAARIIAYGRHTDADVLRTAVADGADEALPRSKFFADVRAAMALGDGPAPSQTSGQG